MAGPTAPAPPDGAPRTTRFGPFERWLTAIVLVGLAFRVVYVVVTRDDTSLCGNLLCGDALFYSGQANTNALGLWWRDFRDWHLEAADHPPLTSLVLTPLARVGYSVLSQRLAMAVLGAAVIVAIAYLARRVAGDRAGLVAAVLAAVNANFWMNDVLVMSETLGTLLIALVLLTTYRYLDRPSVGRAAVVGALVGLAGLARAELLLLLPLTFVPAALLVRRQPVAARLGRVAVAGLVGVAVLVPWTTYNLRRFERPVALSTNDGLTLVGANCDRVYGIDPLTGQEDPGGIGFWNLHCKDDADIFIPPDQVGDQSVQSASYRRIALDYIGNHKRKVPMVVAIRVARGWGVFGPDQMVWLNQGEGRERWASWTGYVMWWLLLVPAVAGAVVLRRRRVPIWPLVSTALVATFTFAVFYGIVRFRLPADVAAVVLAAVAVDALWRRRAGRAADGDDAGTATAAGDPTTAAPPAGAEPADLPGSPAGAS